MVRMDQNRLANKVREAKGGSRRREGRPRKTRLRQVEDVGKIKKTLTEMTEIARDRKAWKNWVNC